MTNKNKKRLFIGLVGLLLVLALSCYCLRSTEIRQGIGDFSHYFKSFVVAVSPNTYDYTNNEYLNALIDSVITKENDSVDLYALKAINLIFINNNDSFHACASNMVLGIVSYRNAVQDSALLYLLTAEQYSDCRPELKPHIYYYLASTFIEFDPILAYDIIYSHPKEHIDRYDYSRFKNVSVSQQEMNAHNVNSIYYSRLLQRSLDAQEKQHQKEKRLYRFIIISVSLLFVLTLLSIVRMMWFRRKTANLTESVANQKMNFNNLLEKYMKLYGAKCDEKTVISDANEILSALRDEFDLSKSDIAIIWLLLLSFSKKDICLTLNIGENYYHQRRTKIRKVLNFDSTRKLENDLKTFVPGYLSEHYS